MLMECLVPCSGQLKELTAYLALVDLENVIDVAASSNRRVLGCEECPAGANASMRSRQDASWRAARRTTQALMPARPSALSITESRMGTSRGRLRAKRLFARVQPTP